MKLNRKQTIYIGLGFLSIMMLWQVYNWYVPLFLDKFLNNLFKGDKIIIGIVMALDNLFATFMIPIMSILSDKCHSKIGKRMPFIIIGIIVSAISFLAMPFINDLDNIWLLILDILIILIAMNTYRSPNVSLMPDTTIKKFHSQANAIINIMGGIGVAIGYFSILFFSKINNKIPFIIVSSLMIIVLIIMIIKINEPKLVKIKQENETDEEIKENINYKSNKRNVILSLLVVFFVYMANNAVETFASLYSSNVYNGVILKINIEPGLLPILFFGIGTFLFAIPAGNLSLKIGKKKTVVLGILLMGLCYLLMSIFQYIFVFTYLIIPIFLIGGAGLAFIIVNIYPMIVDNCNYDNVGRYTGLYYTSSMIAQSITPALCGLFVSKIVFDDMKVLYPYSFIFMLFALLTALFIKDDFVQVAE